MIVKRKKSVDKVKVTHNKPLFYTIIFLLLVVIATAIYVNKLSREIPAALYCESNNDCVPDSCCHAASCTSKNSTPDCSRTFCTAECVAGSLDCNQGSCVCSRNKCSAVLNNSQVK